MGVTSGCQPSEVSTSSVAGAQRDPAPRRSECCSPWSPSGQSSRIVYAATSSNLSIIDTSSMTR